MISPYILTPIQAGVPNRCTGVDNVDMDNRQDGAVGGGGAE